jgi:hypothetical protein
MNIENFLLRDFFWNKAEKVHLQQEPAPGAVYDPELLYVECRLCGKPVLWEEGRTGAIIKAAGLDLGLLDESCLLLSDGCPACKPGRTGFQLHMVRLASLSPQDLLLLGDAQGRA